MKTWNLGDVTVTRVEEQLGFANMPPERYFREFQREVFDQHIGWLAPDHYSPQHDRVITSVHSWIIRTPRQTILVDSCAGNHKHRPWTPRFDNLQTDYLERLCSVVDPGEIDLVCCTHLHADHIGWNTMRRDGRWVPTFPNAKYLFSRAEHAHWDPLQNAVMSSDPRLAAYNDSVLPVIEAGQEVLVEEGYMIDKDMIVELAAGHTPGHYLIRLNTDGKRAIFCGDVIHHAIQVYAPHWNHMADEDPVTAMETRLKTLQGCAETGALLFPTHFGAPHVVSIKASASGFVPTFVYGRDIERG